MEASEIRPPRGFCAAPWIEAVIRIDGSVLPCCRAGSVFGNVGNSSLAEVWNGAIAREFRARIGAGEFPSVECERCYLDGTQTTLRKDFDRVVARSWSRYAEACALARRHPDHRLRKAIGPFHAVVRRTGDSGGSAAPCRRLIFAIHACRNDPLPPAGRTALRQLRKVARACLDFIENRPRARLVGTMRQANLVAVCNARCIYCVGLHTEEIVHGAHCGGDRHKHMTSGQAEAALARPDDLTGFFMNGSEFLLHPEWRRVVERLAARGVLLSLSTNGMLLTPAAAEFLLASDVLGDVNFSFDGATRDTVERIRAGVRYGTLIAHVSAFLRILAASSARIPVSLSMVLLADNVAEAPALVRLVHELRDGRDLPMQATFFVLTDAANASYRAFRALQRVDASDPRARPSLIEAAELGDALGVPTHYSYTGTLRQALEPRGPAAKAETADASGRWRFRTALQRAMGAFDRRHPGIRRRAM